MKIENIQYEFTSRDGFIFFGFYDMTDAYKFETLCSDEKFNLKEYNKLKKKVHISTPFIC